LVRVVRGGVGGGVVGVVVVVVLGGVDGVVLGVGVLWWLGLLLGGWFFGGLWLWWGVWLLGLVLWFVFLGGWGLVGWGGGGCCFLLGGFWGVRWRSLGC
ncbi:hypothetical protein, partial [Pseudomonas syringae group genomosp. 7]|uniref:hypothetical protein n=1 Tax=Pseudomonas syringae group genomosp. 7 TaxID=251699 RepID=UPI00376F82A9